MCKEKIKGYAASIGIELIGFCRIEFSGELLNILAQRKNEGMLSGFEEQDENLRLNVEALMPGAKTIIAIALPYKTIEPDRNKPYFSRSSLGVDYHLVMRKKLDSLGQYLKDNFRANSRVFTDTNPLLEREIAHMSGIGYQGKNTNIITKEYGSFVFLGELLTDLYIEEDGVMEEECGNCESCIRACPTGAIEKAYNIRAHKCLSYVTQKKEILSESEMNKLETRLYGCDICQEVCPKNIDKPLSKIEEFWPQKWNYNIDEERFLKMTNKEFKAAFGNTSSGWRGKLVLQRNMIIAMGNSRNKNFLAMLHEVNADRLLYYKELAIKKIMECDLNE